MTKSSKKTGKSKGEESFDVMIIGGGPAGMSALLWASQLGLKPLLIEQAALLGGQLHSIYNPISNYPGLTTKDGQEMFRHFLRSLEGFENSCRLQTRVSSFDSNAVTARLESGETVSARTAIIATGVRRRRLDIPGEMEFVNRGVLESGAKERTKVAGKNVAIVGGGDAALENALTLAEFAKRVYVIHRRDSFTARDEFVKAAQRNKRIEFLFESRVASIDGDENVSSIAISHSQGRKVLPIDAVLIRIGVEPNSELVRGQLKLDSSGYVIVNSQCETSHLKIFAVGDVANPFSPTIPTAAGTGATAVKAIFPLPNGSCGL